MKKGYLLTLAFLFLMGSCTNDKNDAFLNAWEEAVDAVDNGHYEVANELWKNLAEKYPDQYGVFYNWGTTLVLWGNCGGAEAITYYQQACLQFKKAASLDSSSDQLFYNWGNSYAKMAELDPNNIGNYSEACKMFQKATEINSSHDKAFCNWGIVLLEWAKIENLEIPDKYLLACDKFQKATALNPNKFEAYNSWGNALLFLYKTDRNRNLSILKQTESYFLKSEAINKGYSAYNLACTYALLNDEEKCKQWINIAEEEKTLPTREHAMKDDDLASVRDKEWFKAIHWKGE